MVFANAFDTVLSSVCSCEGQNLCYWHDQAKAKGRSAELLREMKEYLEAEETKLTDEQIAEMENEWREFSDDGER